MNRVRAPRPKNLTSVFCVIALLLGSHFATAQRNRAAEAEPTAAINFLVLKDDNGKPVRNAAVIMHPVSAQGKQQRGGMELKTDPAGKSSFDGLPYGLLRVQVLAPGFQTFGEDYDIRQPKMDVTIRLKRPQGQFSVYEDRPDSKRDDKPPADQTQKPQ